MLDLFCWFGGASSAMRGRPDWKVVGFDVHAPARPDVVADVRSLPVTAGTRPFLIWASPPCVEFSRARLPWKAGRELARKTPPSLELVRTTLAVIERLDPRFWIVENVGGAVPYFEPILGPPVFRWGAIYLWGFFPTIQTEHLRRRFKMRAKGSRIERPRRRAMIPTPFSEAVRLATETWEFAWPQPWSTVRACPPLEHAR